MDEKFWTAIDGLVESSEITIDRPKGSTHPRYPTVVYPMDYGYLVGTKSGDQGGVDIWMGSSDERRVTGILCTIDLDKGDAEVKILLGCTEEETSKILTFHNQGRQSGILIERITTTTTK